MNNYSWEETIKLPILENEKNYHPNNLLESFFEKSILECVVINLEENDGKICATLSGGIDSSYCLSKIRELVGKNVKIHTFTTGSSNKHMDIVSARIISKLFNTIHHELIPSDEAIYRATKQLNALDPITTHSRGDIAVYLTYQNIADHGFKNVMSHDGIDELLGGYWEHRKYDDEAEKKLSIFAKHWNNLKLKHLIPLENKAKLFGINIILPYLQKDFVKFITTIPISKRTSFEVSKIPLRKVAKKYLPKQIIERKKIGFCDALN